MSNPKRQRIDLSDGTSASRPSASNNCNPLNGKPFTDEYYKILETRKGLPVYAQRQEFKDMLASTQCMILVGETGSG